MYPSIYPYKKWEIYPLRISTTALYNYLSNCSHNICQVETLSILICIIIVNVFREHYFIFSFIIIITFLISLTLPPPLHFLLSSPYLHPLLLSYFHNICQVETLSILICIIIVNVFREHYFIFIFIIIITFLISLTLPPPPSFSSLLSLSSSPTSLLFSALIFPPPHVHFSVSGPCLVVRSIRCSVKHTVLITLTSHTGHVVIES